MDLDKAKKGVLDKACPAESHEEDDDEWETIPEGEPVIMTQEQFDGPLYDFESRGRSDPTRPKRLPRDPATAGLPKTILILPLPDRTFRFEPGIEKFSSKAEKYITYKIGPRPRLPEGTTPGWSHEQIKKLKRSDKKKYQAHDRYLRKLKRLGLTEMKAPPGTVFKVLKPPPKDRTEILEQLREQRRLMRARRRLRKETKKMRKRERKAMRREKLAAKIAKKEGEGKTPEEIMEMVRQVEREQKEERKKLASAHTTERARLNSGPGWEKMEKALTTKKTRPKGNPNRKELKWGI
ncbi:hypothetical protein IE53DRAFT_162769 [Violaceomyces palustris]|uniref:Uncharacterized protein n=1 Tax=Violaceomyces palustris TaxID=1673888 RepID=A0ACD0NTM6_9BASI|nr:hypothetical protein IE53DRAFT_162769 [Violaceomyces palustris]